MIRRRSLLLPAAAAATTGAACGLAASRPAWAQTWSPDRPVRLVIPFAAGTGTDIVGRMIAAQLSRGLGGVQVVPDNRAGAGGTIAAQHVAQLPPDGTVLLLGTIGTHTVNPHLMRNLPYDPQRDFTPVQPHSRTRIVLTVRPQLGPRTAQELVALARSRSITVASSGTGTTGHLAQALLNLSAGIETVHVPYRDGARAVSDLLSGQVDAMFYHTQVVRPHIEAGTILGLGVTGEGRSEALPQVPPMAEAGLPRIDVTGWWAIYGPAGMQAPVVRRLNAVLNAGLREQDAVTFFARNDLEPLGGTPEQLSAFQAREFERWGEVVRLTKMTAEG
jgi:tripartite-type tricarboxylate transporter receptor subunit TctC